MKEIDFTNPFNGRKWLNLLEPDERHGLLFKPNLSCEKKHMGFSFRSNRFGLRGDGSPESGTVICGTSYAMGLSVDNGKNWYERSRKLRNAFNIGMPVGTRQHLATLEDFHSGPCDTLVYLYHPNIWTTALSFEKARNNHRNIFEQQGWETDFHSVARLYARWLVKGMIRGKIQIGEKRYRYNPRYSLFNAGGENRDFVKAELDRFDDLFSRFSKVCIIRTPIKEELIHDKYGMKELLPVTDSYRQMFALFEERFGKRFHIFDDLRNQMHIEDYLPCDTHWNETGNEKFARFIDKNTGIVI